jgi:hypothetical protein
MIRTDVIASVLSYRIVQQGLRLARRYREAPWCSARDISRSEPVQVMRTSPRWSAL